jgi:hypothetical protein
MNKRIKYYAYQSAYISGQNAIAYEINIKTYFDYFYNPDSKNNGKGDN